MTSEHVWVSLSPRRPDDRPHWPARAASWVSGSGSPRADDSPRPGLVDGALQFALGLGQDDPAPVPGGGRTRELWETLATLAAADLGAARAIEPHLDALAILDQAGDEGATSGSTPGPSTRGASTWGVFAAEGGPHPLVACAQDGASWTLTGTKPWCSLADRLDRALISAAVGGGGASVPRRLFAVDLRQPGVRVEPGAWHARGLAEVPSGPVHFDGVDAEPVGAAGWYLERPGFAWGGIGVAACWFGGAVGVGRTLAERARNTADLLLQLHLGVVDERLSDARRALAEAAQLVDDGSATGEAGRLLAKRVRATVARASEDVLRHVAHALGPAPLALDAMHAKRVADLELYLRQHHAEKDEASLGRQLTEGTDLPW
ncbi:acyl-CoA dehydrogenase [Subtercola boreus]|uniref:acyl-CoA dehydrogenase n=1 Tax=Subtercola boreus TaxID=120213 RepID=UPI00209BC913|nr:acyl-CoA dehydrogenase [Subtercola boreus]